MPDMWCSVCWGNGTVANGHLQSNGWADLLTFEFVVGFRSRCASTVDICAHIRQHPALVSQIYAACDNGNQSAMGACACVVNRLFFEYDY